MNKESMDTQINDLQALLDIVIAEPPEEDTGLVDFYKKLVAKTKILKDQLIAERDAYEDQRAQLVGKEPHE